MKTKIFTLRIATMALICLFLAGSSISQEARKNLTGSDLFKTTMKSAQKAPGHFNAFLCQSGEDRSLLKKGAENTTYRTDTLFRYSINGGSEKTLNTYNNDGNLLTTLVQVWIIDRWANENVITNVYDANGNLLTETNQLYRSNSWINYRMLTHTYDEAGNRSNTLAQEWDGAAWGNALQSDYTYDGSGNMLTELLQQWDGAAWMYAQLDTYTYDGSGNRLTLLVQGWDGAAWFNNILDTWTYDGNGNMLTYLDQWHDGIDWINGALTTYTYDGNGNMLTMLEQGWDGVAWMNYYLTTWTYDANNNPISVVALVSYDGVTWTNMSMNDWTYDATGNPLTFTISISDWDTGEWQDYTHTEYSYQDGMITANGSTWYATLSAWTIGDAYFPVTYKEDGTVNEFFSGGPAVQVKVYYSGTATKINDPEGGQPGHFTICPNPAYSNLTIVSADPEIKIEQLQLFDLSGKEQLVILTDNQVDISKLQNGFYLLRLTTSDGQTEIKKIVKE